MNRHRGLTGAHENPTSDRLVIAKGTDEGTAFVHVGIFREEDKGRARLYTTDGFRLVWSKVSVWDYLSDVAPEYNIWGD